MESLTGRLCDIHKSNQIESNSQREDISNLLKPSCVISTKVIKLKAIHNAPGVGIAKVLLCDIHKSNQIESNSQLYKKTPITTICCVISTKVIKLKAIHNWWWYGLWNCGAV